MSTTKQVNLELFRRELDLWKTLSNCLILDNKKNFTADDFFQYGLDRYMKDPAHQVGSFFRKLQAQKLIEHVGYTQSTRPSNNHREIRVWRQTPKEEFTTESGAELIINSCLANNNNVAVQLIIN